MTRDFNPVKELDGVYINSLSSEHDTLILASGNTKPIFFLLTRDSLENPMTIRGTWDFGPTSSHSLGIGIHFDVNDRNLSTWSCKVQVKDSTEYFKILILDTLYSITGPSLNSIGRPYRFVKKIYGVNSSEYK